MKALLLAAAALAAGCGSGGMDGSVGGQSLNVQDAVVTTLVGKDGSSAAQVWVTSASNFCSAAASDTLLKDTRFLILQLGIVAPDGVVVAADSAGSYTLNPTKLTAGERVATVAFFDVGGCVDVRESANSGTVVVTHVKKSSTGGIDEMAGSVGLSFSHGTMQGDFQARGCASVNPRAASCQ